MLNSTRTKLLGNYGEVLAGKLLMEAGFSNIRDLNREHVNYPYGDYYAEKDAVAYVISVRTRNKFQQNGRLNPGYNFRKKSADVETIAARLKARLAWIAIQVDVEAQRYWAYFGTMAALNVSGDRYSIPMTPGATRAYFCLADDRFDAFIRPEWNNCAE
jgi:hypothetical protein